MFLLAMLVDIVFNQAHSKRETERVILLSLRKNLRKNTCIQKFMRIKPNAWNIWDIQRLLIYIPVKVLPEWCEFLSFSLGLPIISF